jgi:hypothetical protein
MQISCPEAYSAETSANRASALAQGDFADIAKNAATLYHACFQRLSDPYNRDWANYWYLNMLEFSAACNHTGLEPVTDSLDGATQLAATTTFADVERAAVKLVALSVARQIAIRNCMRSEPDTSRNTTGAADYGDPAKRLPFDYH